MALATIILSVQTMCSAMHRAPNTRLPRHSRNLIIGLAGEKLDGSVAAFLIEF